MIVNKRNITIIALIIIVLSHFVGESIFSRFLGLAKRESLFYLALHCLIYAMVVSMTIYVIAKKKYAHWKFIGLFISHYYIDYWKCYILTKALMNWPREYDIIDQILHLSILTFLYFANGATIVRNLFVTHNKDT